MRSLWRPRELYAGSTHTFILQIYSIKRVKKRARRKHSSLKVFDRLKAKDDFSDHLSVI